MYWGMTMTKPDPAEEAAALARLDAMLDAAARTARPGAVPDALMARLMADARAEMPVIPVRAPVQAGLLARVLAALREGVGQLGGAPALASLGVVGVAGVWLGANPSDAMLMLEEVVFGAQVTLDFAGLPEEFLQ